MTLSSSEGLNGSGNGHAAAPIVRCFRTRQCRRCLKKEFPRRSFHTYIF